jgi:3-oxoacyl-[acyl-carrier-protein] synthase II
MSGAMNGPPSGMPMAVTGWSLHLPGVDLAAGLPGYGGDWAVQARAASCPPEQAGTLLGRRGLLYKEPATRLALCAVHRALGLPPGHRPDGPPDPGTAVVACSNLGNVATVAEVAGTVAADGGRAVSPLAAPNASSNVVATTVALWFRFGGPNLMVCSGTTAGLDALWLAGLLLRAGRAQRVIVVGAEPADEVAEALHKAGPAGAAVPLRAGAGCLVLRAAGDAGADRVLVTPVPPVGPWAVPTAGLTVGPGGFDPAAYWGDCYGAQGVVCTALAASLVADEGLPAVAVRCGGEPDGWRAALVQVAR